MKPYRKIICFILKLIAIIGFSLVVMMIFSDAKLFR